MAIHPTHEREQALVREFFGGETSGFFVDVGANHPTHGSQTHHLEQLGWTGVLVEPQPDLAAFLVSSRNAQVFAAACTSPEQANQSLGLHVDGPRSALDRDKMSPGSDGSMVILVPTRTLDSILEEAQAPAPLDLLSIDVEGHELEVLQGLDFNRWQPSLILIEDHVGGLASHSYLKRGGYKLIRRLGHNGWYVPAADAPKVPLSHRFEIVRKYYLALPFRKVRDASRRIRRAYADWWAGR